MKKFALIFMFLLCFTMAVYLDDESQAIFAFDGKFSLYGVGSCETDCEVVNCGAGIIASVESSKAKTLVHNFNGKVYGYSIELNSLKSLEEILKLIKADVVRKEIVCDREIFYCYSSQTNNYVVEDNKKINYQIVFNNGKIVIGTPLILGSY